MPCCHVQHGADLSRPGARCCCASITELGDDRASHALQVQNPVADVYQWRCARERLLLRDGQIVSRKIGAEVRVMLHQHGGATDPEISSLLDMLRYQLVTDAKGTVE